MLDEVYMEQFDKLHKIESGKRATQRKDLENKILKEESQKSPIKGLLKSISEACEALKNAEEYLKSRGLSINHTSYFNDSHELTFSGRYSDNQHPEMRKFDEESEKLEVEWARRKKEIRARIYGMETTFEVVDKEIKDYIANLLK